jgi:hypothetical protein
MPVEVRGVPDRLNSEIEPAGYFIACGGITNAVRGVSERRVGLGFGRHRRLS